MDSKMNLYNRAKKFIYSPGLEDLHIFSKQYFNSTMIPYHSSNTNADNYAIISIDFNKINDLNNIYGRHTVDKVIHHSLSLIKSVLPPKSICSRIGGDEFIFLINNTSIESIEKIITNIYSILKQHEKEILFTTVTAYGVHCSEKDNLLEMVDEADFKITEQKNNFNKDSSFSKWEILEKKMTQNLTSFFKSLRLYKEPITIDFLRQLYVHAISSSSDLLEKSFSFKHHHLTNKEDPLYCSENELNKVYNLFLEDNPLKQNIDDIDTSTYKSLIETLVRDPVTGHFSKYYFEQYLLTDCKQEYKVQYLSTAFVKLYNTIFSHNATDAKLKEHLSDLFKYLEDNNIHFMKNSFSKENGNYFISLGAGDYLFAVPADNSINDSIINQYIASKNAISSELEDILKLTSNFDFEHITSENFEKELENLSTTSKVLKNKYKIKTFTAPVIKDALNNIIYDSSEYYTQNIPHSDDIKQKSKFLNILSKCILDISYSLNQEQLLDTSNIKD